MKPIFLLGNTKGGKTLPVAVFPAITANGAEAFKLYKEHKGPQKTYHKSSLTHAVCSKSSEVIRLLCVMKRPRFTSLFTNYHLLQ